MFLIAQSKLTYHFFTKSQQVIRTTREIYEIFLALLFSQQVPGLSNRCAFAFGQPTGWDLITATELELIMFRPSPLGELMWHLSTQFNDGDLDA